MAEARGFAATPGWQRVLGDEPVPDLSGLSITQLLTDILIELRDQAQRGMVHAESVFVPNTTVIERLFAPAFFSLRITNDGGGTVQYRIPSDGRGIWADLLVNEIITLTAIKGVFASVAFRVTGAPATVRIVGAY
jgi:hypothetical protein